MQINKFESNFRISVGLPTAGRPEMLRSALHSIANQSRLDLISEIVVSENGGDRSSEAICSEFHTLPIRYIFQDPTVDPALHFIRIVQAGRSDWIALLGDDDMWGRYHLEEAFKSLTENDDAIGYVSQAVIVRNESRQVSVGYNELTPAISGQTSRTFSPYWRWSADDMLTDALARTPFNLWALIARKAMFLDAMQIFSNLPNGADSDRFFWWALSRQGPLLIGREVGLFYRVHESSACGLLLKSSPKFHEKKASDYTIRMINEADADGIEWRQAWVETWNQLKPSEQLRLWKCSINGAKSVLRDELKGLCRFPDPKIHSPIRRFIMWLLPPIITDTLRRLLR